MVFRTVLLHLDSLPIRTKLSVIAWKITKHNLAVASYVKKKGFNYFEASVLSTFLQEVECRLLETLIRYCLEKGLIQDHVTVLCNDGFMLETRLSRPELAVEFNRLILEQHGFGHPICHQTNGRVHSCRGAHSQPNCCHTDSTHPHATPLSPRRLHFERAVRLHQGTRLLNSTIQFDSTLPERELASTKKNKFTKSSREKLEDYSRLPTVTIDAREYAQIQYQRNCYGRCFSKRSGVQNMTKKIRHHLVGEALVDIDTVNSGPSLLYNIVRLYQQSSGPWQTFQP